MFSLYSESLRAYLFKHFNIISVYVFSIISVIISVCIVMHPNTLK